MVVFKTIRSTRRRRMALGAAALVLWAMHGGYTMWIGQPENMLWACHLGTLAVGVGLLIGWPTGNGIGVLWLVLGVPLWVIELITHGGCDLTSTLSHLGGFLLGLMGVRIMGLPKGTWWKAVGSLYLLHLASRWATPEQANINLAFRIWTGWEPFFPSHGVYILAILALACLLFAATDFVLRRTGFARLHPGDSPSTPIKNPFDGPR